MTARIKRAVAGFGLFLAAAVLVGMLCHRAMPGATSAAAFAPPTAPSNCDAVAQTDTKINILWRDNSTNETGFKIERCTGAGCANFVQVAQVGANVTSYSNIGLVANTTYNYRVRSYSSTLGNSTYSNTDSAKTYPTGQSCTETPCP